MKWELLCWFYTACVTGINFKNGFFFFRFFASLSFQSWIQPFSKAHTEGERGELVVEWQSHLFVCHHFVLHNKQVLTSIKHSLGLPVRGLFKAKARAILTKAGGCSQGWRQERAGDGCGQSHTVMQAAARFISSSNSSSRAWSTATVSSCSLQGCPFFYH